MNRYLILIKLTEQGIRTIKEAPKRTQAARQAIQAAGGQMLSWHMLMGEYDIAVMAEFPNDEALARVALAVGSQGNVRTTTMRAFTEEEFQRIVATLP